VRLIGIDCPESKPNAKAKRDSERTGQDFETITKMGQEATEFVKGIVNPGDKVELEFDVLGRDKYGRWLAYVKLYKELYSAFEPIDGVQDVLYEPFHPMDGPQKNIIGLILMHI